MTFQVDTSPVAAAATALATMADRLGDPSPVVSQVAAATARLAAPVTPRRTGRLAGSVRVTEGPKATVRWGVPYAVYVNYGTRVMAARPFATDALQAAEPVLAAAASSWAAGIMDGGA